MQFKKLRHLSPSSLNEARNKPHLFLLRRLIETPLIGREPQGLPAAVGTAFDIQVKQLLIKKKVACHEPMQKIVDSLTNHHEEANRAGKHLLNLYKRSGLLDKTNWVGVEQHFTKDIEGVTMHGQLDASVFDTDTGLVVPNDWKVMGYNTPMSPKKGYRYCYNSETTRRERIHSSYRKDLSVEQVDETWGQQFCTYGWGLGIPYKTRFPVYIHSLVYNGIGRVVKICEYRVWVTKKFQQDVMERYQYVWDLVESGRFHTKLKIPKESHLLRNDLQRLSTLIPKARRELARFY